jgi:hypothetical protein
MARRGSGDPWVPALPPARVRSTFPSPARTRGAPAHSPAPARGGMEEKSVSGDAGRGLGFARREPGWGGRPGNQSAVGCTPRAWPAHIQGTKHSSSALSNAGSFACDWLSLARGEGIVAPRSLRRCLADLPCYVDSGNVGQLPDNRKEEEAIVMHT